MGVRHIEVARSVKVGSMVWKKAIQKSLSTAMESQNQILIASNLRHAARQAYIHEERDLALEIIILSLDFAENSNIFFLALLDYHYYRTGNRVDMNDIPKIEAPTPCQTIPWPQLRKLIQSL